MLFFSPFFHSVRYSIYHLKMLFMLMCNGFVLFSMNYYIGISNLSVLISKMANIDKYDSHKQKILGGGLQKF